MEEHIGSKWTADDLLPVNGTEEEVEALAAKAAKLEKRAAKSAKSALSAKAAGSVAVSQAVVVESLKRSLEVWRAVPRAVRFCPARRAVACRLGCHSMSLVC